MLICSLSLFSCQDETQGSSFVTSQVNKIETSYSGGQKAETVSHTDRQVSVLSGEKLVQYDIAEAKLIEKIANKLAVNGRVESAFAAPTTIYDVGVIPNIAGVCLGGEAIEFLMDNEDDGNHSEWILSDYRGSWVLGSGQTYGGNIRMRFCRVDGRLFSSNEGQMTLLRLGSVPPSTSAVALARRFDNEDKNNINSTSGNISPSANTGNTTMHFWAWTSPMGAGINPSLGFGYGVIGNWSYNNHPGGSVITDDENGANINYLRSWNYPYNNWPSSGYISAAVYDCGYGFCNGLLPSGNGINYAYDTRIDIRQIYP